MKDLEAYVRQNSSEDIMRKRQLRMALRALEGQFVRWPYDYVQEVGDHDVFCCCGKRYGAQPEGWREVSAPYGEEGSHMSVADIVDADSLGRVREHKKAAKAAARVGKDG